MAKRNTKKKTNVLKDVSGGRGIEYKRVNTKKYVPKKEKKTKLVEVKKGKEWASKPVTKKTKRGTKQVYK